MSASLLETFAALVVSAGLFATLSASIVAQARLGDAARRVAGRQLSWRQLEHLVDVAAGQAGGGPAALASIATMSAAEIVQQSDRDGDGRVDDRSAERTAVALRDDGPTTSVQHRIGRQSMTVVDAADPEPTLLALDAAAQPTAAPLEIRLIGVRAAEHASGDPRALLFAFPAQVR